MNITGDQISRAACLIVLLVFVVAGLSFQAKQRAQTPPAIQVALPPVPPAPPIVAYEGKPWLKQSPACYFMFDAAQWQALTNSFAAKLAVEHLTGQTFLLLREGPVFRLNEESFATLATAFPADIRTNTVWFCKP